MNLHTSFTMLGQLSLLFSLARLLAAGQSPSRSAAASAAAPALAPMEAFRPAVHAVRAMPPLPVPAPAPVEAFRPAVHAVRTTMPPMAVPAPVPVEASVGPQVLCPSQGGLRVGHEVFHVQRGVAVLACQSRRAPEFVGLCGAPYSGHNSFIACEGGGNAPPFCGPESLWFARCGDLTPAASEAGSRGGGPHLGGQRVPYPVTDDGGDSCGCSWNAKAGCTVSGPQMIAALTKSDMVGDRYCGEHAQQNQDALSDCLIRREVYANVQSFKKCQGLGPRDCAEATECQWGSQGSGQCGIDEEQLVARLVGPEYRNHPLVQMVMLHDHCSKHSEEWCAADASCAWTPHPVGAVCDVSPDFMIKVLVAHPSMVLGLMHSSEQGLCGALDEGSCVGRCRWQGRCVLKEEALSPHPLEEMTKVLCLQSYRLGKSCPAPCRMVAASQCGPPEVLPWRNSTGLLRDVTQNRVVKIMALLSSSTMFYEARCRMMQHSPAARCQASAPTCDVNSAARLGSEGSAAMEGRHHSGPGLKGLIKTAAAAIAEGKAGDFLNDYLENNPDKVKVITETALDKLSSLLLKPGKRPPGHARAPEEDGSEFDEDFGATEEQLQKEAKQLKQELLEREVEELKAEVKKAHKEAPAAGGFAAGKAAAEEGSKKAMLKAFKEVAGLGHKHQTAVVDDEEEGEEESPAEIEAEEKGTMMMGAALGGAVLSAICAGVAFGALCHAGLLKGQAREPLLAGETAATASRGGLREQELETAPAMMRHIEA